jgi:hypothetical protein
MMWLSMSIVVRIWLWPSGSMTTCGWTLLAEQQDGGGVPPVVQPDVVGADSRGV